MYKFDRKVWNHRVRKTVIVSLLAPLFSTFMGITAPSANAAFIAASDGSCIQDVGVATGITVTKVGNDCLITFNAPSNTTTTHTWKVPSNGSNFQILVVGGGGGGGADGGNGGGGGELRFGSAASAWVPAAGTELTLQVGAGGVGGSWSAGTVSSSGVLSQVSWGGSARFIANPGTGGGGWTSSVVPTGGSGGSGGTGTVGQSATAVQSGCGTLSATQNNTAGKWYTSRWFLNGGSGAGTALTTTAPSNSITGSDKFYGGAGGGGWGGSINSGATGPIYGLAGGGTVDNVSTSGGRGANWLYVPGDNHTTSWSGASAGAQGVDATGGGGGGGHACDPTINGSATTNGTTKRTSGGRGGSGVVVIRYTPVIFTVTFDANGGSGSPSATTVSQTPTSNSITLANAGSLSRSGYRFAGWNTAADGTGTNYAAGSTFTPTSNITLYAQWNSTISYNGNTATSTRAIESSSSVSASASTTLSNGSLLRGAPISNGLVLHLDGADASTVSGSSWTNKVAGVTGAEASATMVGSPTYDATEGAFTLNGTSQYFSLGTTNYLFNGAVPFTLNLTFKASDPNKDNCLIGNFNGGVGATYMYRLVSNVLSAGRNVAPWSVTGTTLVPAGEIVHASYSFDGSNMRLYLNGNLYATSALINSSVSHNGNPRIGACQDNSATSRLFKGQIYNAQIYNRALSGTEIATNFDNLMPGRLVVKDNFTLGAWNTQSNGSGTSYGSLNTDLAALPTPHFRVSAENYSGGTLSASVGGSNLSIKKNGSPILNSNSGGGFGANARFPTISGAPGDGFRLGNAELPNYTFCGMARYKDLDTGVRSTRGRIFAHANTTNWISGWYGGGTKNFYHNDWLLTYTDVGDSKWHVMCESGNRIYWDGVQQTVTNRIATTLPPLAINWTEFGDNSNFEFTEAIVYNQALSAAQINTIFRYFENKFGLTDIVTTSQSAARFVPPSNYASTGDTTLQATWVSQITYDGNKQTSGTAPSTQTITNSGGTVASVGTLARTGYVFAGWNTAANGSGTRYAPGAALINDGNKLLYAQWVLPVTLPTAAFNPSSLNPYMRLEAPNYDSTNKIWRDSSGNSRNVTRVVGTPTITTSTIGNGSSKSFQTIAGVTADKFYFDNDPISTNWTVLALSRYSGAGNRARILAGNYSASAYQDSNGNWLMGHWNGGAAIAHHNGWIANVYTTPAGYTVSDWIMSTSFPYNYRANGISRGTSGGTAELPPIGINTHTGEQSDYQVAEVIIFDRTLSSSEISQVEDYFDERYGLSYAKVGSYKTANTLAIGAGVGGRSDTFTAIDGLGNKTFSISPVVSGITLDTSTANGVAVVVGPLVPSGIYVETITATDQAGFTSSHVLTITVSSAVKFDTNTATSVITTSGRAARLQLNTINGVGAKVFTMTQTSSQTSTRITLDTSTASSGFATIVVDTFTAPGTYVVNAVVTDSTNLRSTYIVTITVNAPPTLSSTSAISTAPVLSDLRVNLDAGNPLSYSGSGSTWTDLSGNGRNSTLQSTPTFDKSNGGILNFNGSSQFATVPSVRSETFTVEAWVKFNALGTGNYPCVVTNQYSADKINYMICFWNGSSIRAGYHQAGTGWIGGTTGAFTPVVGTWYQLVYKVEKVGTNYIGSLYQNGNLVSGQTTSTIAPNNDQLVDIIGRQWNSNVYINGSIPIVRIYSRSLSDAEIIQNYNATSPRFLNSPTNSVALSTTQGVATSTSIYYAGLGTGAKTFTISPSVAGVTLDTSTVNTVKVNYSNALTATDSATAKTITQTITAFDSQGQVAATPLYVTTTVNPPIVITASTPLTLSTTAGLTAYDTFTATRGAGGPYTFTVTSSAYQSAFTMTKPSANVGLLTVANNLPAGTYYETITATDSTTASTSYLLTVIVNPALTLTGATSNSVSTTLGRSISLRVNVANGTGARTMTITSPHSGITLDSSTITSGYVTINASTAVPLANYSVPLTVRDSIGATRAETFTITVNKWPFINAAPLISNGLVLNLDASSYSGTGQWADSSGNGYNATLGSASTTPTGTSPVFTRESGGFFDYTTNSQHIQASALPSMETFTVSTWVKMSSATQSGNPAIVAQYSTGTNNVNFTIQSLNGKIVGGYRVGGNWSTAMTGFTPDVNTWMHITYVVAKNGTNSYSNRLYKNGVLQESMTSTTVPTSNGGVLLLGRRWDLATATFTGDIAGVTVHNRALSQSEILQNYNIQGTRFGSTSSGLIAVETTEGLSRNLGPVVAVDGTGTKNFGLTGSPTTSGFTLETSTPNQFSLAIAGSVAATNSTTARTYFETVTATDTLGASTALTYVVTVNPPVQETFTVGSITTTSGIAAYETFTATYGTGNKTFTLTGSPTTSGFTLTQSNNVAVLKVEPTVNPGTYYETVTATDTLGASRSLMITVIVRPGPSLLGSTNLVSARGIAFVSPPYSVVNGIAPYTYSLTSKAVSPDTNTVTGITFDTATMTLRVSAAVGAGTYLETITVRDSKGATSNYLISLEVKPPVVLSGSMSITKTYGDLTVSNYTTTAGIAPFSFTTSTSAVNNVCVPMTGTYIGDGTNGTLGVSYTYEKIVSTDRCSWVAPVGVTSVDYSVVGGGGGGGNGRGGGGGGGGVASGTGLSVTPGIVYDIAVAVGGTATNDGNDSWIRSADQSTTFVYAAGGGAGGSMSENQDLINGNNGKSVSPSGRTAGGSGGGGGNNFYTTAAWTGAPGDGGTGAVSGYVGGGSYRCSTTINSQDGNTSAGGNGGRTTGGGGGAGGAGIGYSGSCPTYSASQAPNGGAGVVSRLTGSAETYGGGGGGADGRTEATSEANYRSSGRGLGNGGGGNGQTYRQADGTLLGTPIPATSGDYNTGGGGGGGIYTAGNGGSGVVVLRYLTPAADSQTVTMYTVSNGVSSAGSITLTIPENTAVGSLTSKLIRVTQAGGVVTDYTISVTINKATPTIALSLPGSVTTAKYGTPVSITAVSVTPGSVIFKDGTNVISGCESVTATSGIATCSWTPSAIGSRTITAKLTPTDTANYNSSADTTFGVTVGKADTMTVTATDEAFDFTNSAVLVTKRFTYNGLVSIDTLTAVSMVYSGTANDSTVYSSSTAPTLAGTYLITPDTSTAGISTIAGNYASIAVVPGTLTINRILPTTFFTFANSNTVTYAPNATLASTANSRSGDGARTYSTDAPSKCSISDTPTVSVLEAGSCIVNMIVAQSANYLTKTDSATITINKASRTISLSSNVASLKYTETATVTTTISGGSTDGTITYGLNANPACSFDALGGVLTATAGTGTCTVSADISEGTNFLANTVSGTLTQTIVKADAPTIVIDTVTAVDYVPGVRAQISPTYTISGFKGTDAASSLTLTYNFVSNPFETFSYSDTRTPIDAGTYSIVPSAIVMSSGLATNYETPNYSAAAINFTVNRIAQAAITIDGVNGEVDVPFTLVYRGGNNPTGTATFTKVSGTACSVTGNGLNATEAGLCVVTVSLTGNRNYLPITSDSITVRVRSYTLIPVFVFGNGSTGISIASNTPLTKDEDSCTTGCVPTLTLSTPYEGAEGDVITLTGTFFTGARRVIFNVFTDASTFSVDSDTQITVQVPAGLTPGDGTNEVVTARGVTPRYFDFTVLP